MLLAFAVIDTIFAYHFHHVLIIGFAVSDIFCNFRFVQVGFFFFSFLVTTSWFQFNFNSVCLILFCF